MLQFIKGLIVHLIKVSGKEAGQVSSTFFKQESEPQVG